MKMATALSTRTCSLADLMPSYEFQCLTPRQKFWVKTLLESGEKTGTYNFLGATAIAFPDAKNRSLVVRSSQLQSHPKVKRILNIYFGRPETEDDPFFAELKTAIRKSLKRDGGLSVATTRAISLYERLTGVNPTKRVQEAEAEVEPEVVLTVGEIVEQDGIRYEVTGVDEHGTPITRELAEGI
jgi:hypothetical protein